MPDGVQHIDPDIVAGRIAKLLQARRSGAVKPLLAALQKLAPEHKDLALLQNAYFCQTGDYPQALQVLEQALAREPQNAMLQLRHPETRFGQGDYASAAAEAAEVVVEARDLRRAKSVLGMALLKLGQFKSALPCLADGFAADPSSVDVALALAALAPEHAVQVLQQAIAATPNLAVLRNALTRRLLAIGEVAQAIGSADRARADGLADAETFCLLAFAKMQQRCWEDAAIAAAQALSLAPGHSWATRLVAALSQRESGVLTPVPQQDALAAEQAVIAGGTILPGSFRTQLEQAHPDGPVLDLFCGTGLNAIAAQEICAVPWTGVEPDPVLRGFCAERGFYAGLEDGSPLDLLGARQFAVILLNEALAYAAEPQAWLSGVRAGLAPGGIAFAAIPSGRPGLTGHGLFAHNLSRIAGQAAQAGLAFSLLRTGTLRHIEGLPLHGSIAGFQPA